METVGLLLCDNWRMVISILSRRLSKYFDEVNCFWIVTKITYLSTRKYNYLPSSASVLFCQNLLAVFVLRSTYLHTESMISTRLDLLPVFVRRETGYGHSVCCCVTSQLYLHSCCFIFSFFFFLLLYRTVIFYPCSGLNLLFDREVNSRSELSDVKHWESCCCWRKALYTYPEYFYWVHDMKMETVSVSHFHWGTDRHTCAFYSLFFVSFCFLLAGCQQTELFTRWHIIFLSSFHTK